MLEIISKLPVIIGGILIIIGAFCDVMAALGFFRFKNFYVRLHALTVGAIGGTVLPLIGVSILSAGCEFLGVYRWYIAGGSIVTAILILILAPTGSHAIARAAYRSKTVSPWPVVVDDLAVRMHKLEKR